MDQMKVNRAVKRMVDARAILIKENPFFGHLAMNLKLACGSCGTACTDGTRLIMDPEFADILSEQELQFVILHELLHCVLDHCVRGKSLQTDLYNIACDIVVNSTILDMWGMETMQVAGEEPMHHAPNGREGRYYNAEEVYEMLLYQGKKSPETDAGHMQLLDRHDLWQGIVDPILLKDSWIGRIVNAVKDSGGLEGMSQSIRKIVEKLLDSSKVDWRQILHDFIQHDTFDYTFLPPDRRFSEGDFFLPAYNLDETSGSVNDVWLCIDTSASISKEELSEVFGEVRDAMQQVGLTGAVSWFDHTITEPEVFSNEKEFMNLVPKGGGGTSFHIIFQYLKSHIYPELPKAILIFTDGYAIWPDEKEALGVPVLWIISEGGRNDVPWGCVVQL